MWFGLSLATWYELALLLVYIHYAKNTTSTNEITEITPMAKLFVKDEMAKAGKHYGKSLTTEGPKNFLF